MPLAQLADRILPTQAFSSLCAFTISSSSGYDTLWQLLHFLQRFLPRLRAPGRIFLHGLPGLARGKRLEKSSSCRLGRKGLVGRVWYGFRWAWFDKGPGLLGK